MSVSLAFSTNAYTRFSLAAAVRRIAACGYRGVEILGDRPHAYPPEFSPQEVKELKALLDELGLAVSNFNANTMFGYWTDAPAEPFFEPSLVSESKKHRTARRKMILRSLEIAAGLGAGSISITSGRPLGGMTPERCAEAFGEECGIILQRAERLGVNVGIECEPGLLIERSDELLSWIARLDSPRVGANLDVGHAVVAGEDPAAAIERLAGRIWNLHLEDICARKHYHRIPGEGEIDFAAIAAALERTGYDGFATVELYTQTADPDAAARRSLEVLGPVFE